jgi:hypothetical protein
MSHAKSLRVIGQALEAARIPTFELEKYGPQYMVWIVSVSAAGEAVMRNALRHNHDMKEARSTANRVFCFSPADISRLDAYAQKQRRRQSSSGTPVSKLLSHGLRTLGDHFDRMQVSAFRIEWKVGVVSIDYQRSNGERNCQTLTTAELQYLCEHSRTRRRNAGQVGNSLVIG